MKLYDGFIGRTYCIDKIHLNTYEVLKLHRLKIEEGSFVTLVKKDRGYPFLIELEGNRIAFSKHVAKQIEVIPYG